MIGLFKHLKPIFKNKKYWNLLILILSILFIIRSSFVAYNFCNIDESFSNILSSGFNLTKEDEELVIKRKKYIKKGNNLDSPLTYEQIKNENDKKSILDVVSATINDNGNGLGYYLPAFYLKKYIVHSSAYKFLKIFSILITLGVFLVTYLICKRLYGEKYFTYGFFILLWLACNSTLLKYSDFIRAYPLATLLCLMVFLLAEIREKANNNLKLFVYVFSIFTISTWAFFTHVSSLAIIGLILSYCLILSLIFPNERRGNLLVIIPICLALLVFFTSVFTWGYEGYLNMLNVSLGWKKVRDGIIILDWLPNGIKLTPLEFIKRNMDGLSRIIGAGEFGRDIGVGVVLIVFFLIAMRLMPLRRKALKVIVKQPIIKYLWIIVGYIAFCNFLMIKEQHFAGFGLKDYRGMFIIPFFALLIGDVITHFIFNQNNKPLKITSVLLYLFMLVYSTIFFIKSKPVFVTNNAEIERRYLEMIHKYKETKEIPSNTPYIEDIEARKIEAILYLEEKAKGYRFY